MESKLKIGKIQVYTGDGKGKSTAALGLALRAAGRDFKVFICQFMKGRNTGEYFAIRKFLSDNIYIHLCGSEKFILDRENPLKRKSTELEKDWKFLNKRCFQENMIL